MKSTSWLAWPAVAMTVALAATLTSQPTSAAPGNAAGGASIAAVSDVVTPEGKLPPSTQTAQEQAALAERHLERREQVAAAEAVKAPVAGQPQRAGKKPAQTELNQGVGTNALLIRRNNRNTRASQAGGSNLAEPAAANRGNTVFYTGNTYASFSNDLGVTWTNVALPGGPADAPNACCDQDVVRAHSQDRIFSILLYLNATGTNGGVRIFVRQAPGGAPLCTYYIDPAGAANDVVPDYPHIGLSRNFLYMGLNNLRNGGTWIGAQMIRFNLAQMSACQSTATNTLTWTGSVGQRLLNPVEGAQNATTMYFAAIESSSSIRVFSWPESSTSVSHVVRNIASSNFTNPDCRGGTGNFDFIERGTSWSAAGFRMRGALHGGRVTWFWHSNATGGITQGHIRAASFRTSDLALMEQPHIWNASFCFGYPVVSGNIFGDLGISLAAGGASGGGGTAAQGYVGVDDTPGNAIHFGTVILTASGTHNRTDGRFGDYFTVRPNARCQNAWVGTNYALLNGTATANVNARYVEFGSTLDDGCF